MPEIKVTGESVGDVMHALRAARGDIPYMLTIDPILDYNRDDRGRAFRTSKVPPVLGFMVNWQGQGEAFKKRIDSTKDVLIEVGKVLKAYDLAKKEDERLEAAKLAADKAHRFKLANETVKVARAALRKALQEKKKARGKS